MIKMYFIQTPIIKLTTNSTNFSDIILHYNISYITIIKSPLFISHNQLKYTH